MDFPLVLLDDLLDRRQSQSGSGAFGREVWFKNLVDVFRENGNAVVLNGDLDMIPGFFQWSDGNPKVPARRHGFEGILKNTQKRVSHFCFIPSYLRQPRRIFLLDFDPVDAKVRGDERQSMIDEVLDSAESPVEL